MVPVGITRILSAMTPNSLHHLSVQLGSNMASPQDIQVDPFTGANNLEKIKHLAVVKVTSLFPGGMDYFGIMLKSWRSVEVLPARVLRLRIYWPEVFGMVMGLDESIKSNKTLSKVAQVVEMMCNG